MNSNFSDTVMDFSSNRAWDVRRFRSFFPGFSDRAIETILESEYRSSGSKANRGEWLSQVDMKSIVKRHVHTPKPKPEPQAESKPQSEPEPKSESRTSKLMSSVKDLKDKFVTAGGGSPSSDPITQSAYFVKGVKQSYRDSADVLAGINDPSSYRADKRTGKLFFGRSDRNYAKAAALSRKRDEIGREKGLIDSRAMEIEGAKLSQYRSDAQTKLDDAQKELKILDSKESLTKAEKAQRTRLRKASDDATQRIQEIADSRTEIAQNLYNVDPKLSAKIDRQLEKAAEKDADALSQARYGAVVGTVNTGKDMLGAVKDAVSAKSRAQTVAMYGQEGIQQRNARIAYALGDRSLTTKIAAGKVGKNTITHFLGKHLLTNTIGGGNKVKRNVRNYYRGFSEDVANYISFSEGPTLEETSGEGWQEYEWGALSSILDKIEEYQKLDQKLLEQGEFSEESETPTDGRVILDSRTLRPGYNDEVTVDDILTKNYYEASDIEKKFQEMITKGFSQDPTYESYLESLSSEADMMRY